MHCPPARKAACIYRPHGRPHAFWARMEGHMPLWAPVASLLMLLSPCFEGSSRISALQAFNNDNAHARTHTHTHTHARIDNHPSTKLAETHAKPNESSLEVLSAIDRVKQCHSWTNPSQSDLESSITNILFRHTNEFRTIGWPQENSFHFSL